MDRRVIGVFGYVWAFSFILAIWFLLGNKTYSGLTIYFLIVYAFTTFFLIYFVFAPQNLFFTMVGEGTCKFIDRSGRIIASLLQLTGHDIEHQPDGDIVECDNKKKILGALGPWNLWGGLWFYGLWPICDVHIYEFEWTNITESGQVKHHEKRWIDYIMVKMDTYYQKLAEVESADLVPLIIEAILSIKVINPFKARFLVQGWLSATFELTSPRIRDAVSQENYQDLQKRQQGKKELGKNIFSSIGDEVDRMREKMGVLLISIGIKDINPTEKYRDDTLRAYTAAREGEAVIIMARKEAEAAVIKAEAKAQALRIVNDAVKEYGDLGRFLEALRVAREPGGNMGDLVKVHLLPDIAAALQGKDTRRFSEDELKLLIEEVISSKK